ncbi:hypothetical protein [Streptomyces sp. NPDC056672]|uniref:hypothetical protein n=1 Tax=Streptomyces sp. NPDC056672 TaxID=3345906 RepID=UPI0036822886
MSTEQHDADVYGEELARIRQHARGGTNARFIVFQALAAAGVSPRGSGRAGAAPLPRTRTGPGWRRRRRC